MKFRPVLLVAIKINLRGSNSLISKLKPDRHIQCGIIFQAKKEKESSHLAMFADDSISAVKQSATNLIQTDNMLIPKPTVGGLSGIESGDRTLITPRFRHRNPLEPGSAVTL